MLLFPAIDLYEGKAVRLYKGRYEDMTIYSKDPGAIGEDFAACGASHIHIVDLEGAKEGTTPNFETVCDIKRRSGCFCFQTQAEPAFCGKLYLLLWANTS